MNEKLVSLSDGEAQFDKVVDILKKYNFDDIFLWLQVTSTHPSNQKYFARIDLINALLLSIPSDQFKGITFLQEDCKKLFDYLDKNYGSYFVSVEDYAPFDQLKLIPYFYEKKKYYFYYSIFVLCNFIKAL